jgi:hypothetical protein
MRKDDRVADEQSQDAAAQLVHAEALRLLEQQEAELVGIRGRAVAILSAAGLVNGLFGVKLVGKHHYTAGQLASIWIAVVAFGLMAACVIVIEWPRKFRFAEYLGDWLLAIEEGQARPPIGFWFHFARQFYDFREYNRPKINRLYQLFTASCVLLGLQVICWGLSVALG